MDMNLIELIYFFRDCSKVKHFKSNYHLKFLKIVEILFHKKSKLRKFSICREIHHLTALTAYNYLTRLYLTPFGVFLSKRQIAASQKGISPYTAEKLWMLQWTLRTKKVRESDNLIIFGRIMSRAFFFNRRWYSYVSHEK